jgi:hypothetical protein
MNRNSQNKVTVDADNILLRRIFAFDSNNQQITPNYILNAVAGSEAKWIDTLENIKLYGIDLVENFKDISDHFTALSNFFTNDLTTDLSAFGFVKNTEYSPFKFQTIADISDLRTDLSESVVAIYTDISNLSNYVVTSVIEGQLLKSDLSEAITPLYEEIRALSNITVPGVTAFYDFSNVFQVYSNTIDGRIADLFSTKTSCNDFSNLKYNTGILSNYTDTVYTYALGSRIDLTRDISATNQQITVLSNQVYADLSNITAQVVSSGGVTFNQFTVLSNKVDSNISVTAANTTFINSTLPQQFSTVGTTITLVSNTLSSNITASVKAVTDLSNAVPTIAFNTATTILTNFLEVPRFSNDTTFLKKVTADANIISKTDVIVSNATTFISLSNLSQQITTISGGAVTPLQVSNYASNVVDATGLSVSSSNTLDSSKSIVAPEAYIGGIRFSVLNTRVTDLSNAVPTISSSAASNILSNFLAVPIFSNDTTFLKTVTADSNIISKTDLIVSNATTFISLSNLSQQITSLSGGSVTPLEVSNYASNVVAATGLSVSSSNTLNSSKNFVASDAYIGGIQFTTLNKRVNDLSSSSITGSLVSNYSSNVVSNIFDTMTYASSNVIQKRLVIENSNASLDSNTPVFTVIDSRKPNPTDVYQDTFNTFSVRRKFDVTDQMLVKKDGGAVDYEMFNLSTYAYGSGFSGLDHGVTMRLGDIGVGNFLRVSSTYDGSYITSSNSTGYSPLYITASNIELRSSNVLFSNSYLPNYYNASYVKFDLSAGRYGFNTLSPSTTVDISGSLTVGDKIYAKGLSNTRNDSALYYNPSTGEVTHSTSPAETFRIFTMGLSYINWNRNGYVSDTPDFSMNILHTTTGQKANYSISSSSTFPPVDTLTMITQNTITFDDSWYIMPMNAVDISSTYALSHQALTVYPYYDQTLRVWRVNVKGFRTTDYTVGGNTIMSSYIRNLEMMFMAIKKTAMNPLFNTYTLGG